MGTIWIRKKSDLLQTLLTGKKHTLKYLIACCSYIHFFRGDSEQDCENISRRKPPNLETKTNYHHTLIPCVLSNGRFRYVSFFLLTNNFLTDKVNLIDMIFSCFEDGFWRHFPRLRQNTDYLEFLTTLWIDISTTLYTVELFWGQIHLYEKDVEQNFFWDHRYCPCHSAFIYCFSSWNLDFQIPPQLMFGSVLQKVHFILPEFLLNR